MNQPLGWFLLLSLCCLQDTSATIECLPNNSCSQCYAALVQQVTQNDKNQFQVQKTFFPPDKAPPKFVTIFIEYYQDGELLPNKTDPWFWSTSTFYLYHPLHVFQFTSLLFSDMSIRTADLTLELDADCLDANKDHMRLFVQRLKVHATKKTISSPISDDYNPKVETAVTIKKWQDNTNSSNYICSTFYTFPFLATPLLLFTVLYFNDLAEHNRMTKTRTIFRNGDTIKIKRLKYQLQNEFVMSHIFVLYTVVLAILGVGYTIDTGKHINSNVTNYFDLRRGTVRSRHFTSLSIVALGLDIVIVPLLMLLVAVLCYCFKETNREAGQQPNEEAGQQPNEEAGQQPNEEVGQQPNVEEGHQHVAQMWMWRYCAYSIVFPLCCAANHLNYIIIAFVHDMYHATGVAIVYGIIIFFLYAVLRQVSYFFDKLQLKKDCHFMTLLLFLKFLVVLILIGYLLYDVLLFYVLPINNGFDDATNHLLSLYQTTAVFFAAIVAYFFFNKPFRSPISIFTKAEDQSHVLVLNQNNEWKNMPSDERDLLMARKILGVLHNLGQLQ